MKFFGSSEFGQFGSFGGGGASGGGGVTPPSSFAPNPMFPSDFWNPTSRLTGADTGLNGAPAPTASPVLRGSGHPFKIVGAHTASYYDCIESDADYIMFWGGGDPVLMGAWTLEITYEGTVQTFDQSHCQYDSSLGIYGIPVSFRPRLGISGTARWYAKFIPTNGYERLMTGLVWHNRPITANYYDRHANAIYVSGANFQNSDSVGFVGVGTATGAAGTATAPNPNIQISLGYVSGSREGCYIYHKGITFEDTDGGSRPVTSLPCRVLPWPGTNKNQCMISKTDITTNATRGGRVMWNNGQLEITNVRVDADKFIGMMPVSDGQKLTTYIGVSFEGTLNGGLDQWGFPQGHLQSVTSGVTSNQFFPAINGNRIHLRQCTFYGMCFAGATKIVNCVSTCSWDTFFLSDSVDVSVWNLKAFQPEYARARFHREKELTVSEIVYQNGWCEIRFSGSPTLIDNSFETYLAVLTGALAGNVYGAPGTIPVGTTSPTVKTAYENPQPNFIVLRANSASGIYASFPATNTIYVALNDLGSLGLAVGDKVRSWNIPHADALQFGQLIGMAWPTLNKQMPNNYYIQSYRSYAATQQGMLTQSNSLSGGAFTVSITGTTAVFSTAVTLQDGMVLSLKSSQTSANGLAKYAQIVGGGTGTTFTLDRPMRGGDVVNSFFTIGFTITDVLIENCIFDKLGTDSELYQWQHGHKNWTLMYNTFYSWNPTATLSVLLRSGTLGFGMAGVAWRHNVLCSFTADLAPGFPPETEGSWNRGLIVDGNHYFIAAAQPQLGDANATIGDAQFNGRGNPDAGYFPTFAGVKTVASPFLKYDARGRIRTPGSKVGAVVAA